MRYTRNSRKKVLRIERATSNSFTLVELITAMAVFTVIMLVMVKILGAAQEAWLKSEERNEIYENSQLVFDYVAAQLQSAQYANGSYPFWHYRTIQSVGAFNPTDPSTFEIATSTDPQAWSLGLGNKVKGAYDFLSFVTSSSTHNDAGISNEVESTIFAWHDWKNSPRQYEETANLFRGEDGWIRVNTTIAKMVDDGSGGLELAPNWNYPSNFIVADETTSYNAAFTTKGADKNATASMSDWRRYIANVTGLEFTCYREDGFEIPPDVTTTSGDHDCRDLNRDGSINCWKDSGTPCAPTDTFSDGRRAFDEHRDYFPAYVKVKLSLLGTTTYRQWVQLAGDKVTPYNEDHNSDSYKFRMKHQRVFTRIIVIRSKLRR